MGWASPGFPLSGLDSDQDSHYPDHEPIDIRSDEELFVPDAASGNGVRRGTGTADDPFVIENWTIPFHSANDLAGIYLTDTSAHIVIRNIDFEPEAGESGFLWIHHARNVTVENLRISGSSNPDEAGGFGLFHNLKHIAFRNLSFQDNMTVRVRDATDVLIRDMTMDGDHIALTVSDGIYTLRNLTFHGYPVPIGTVNGYLLVSPDDSSRDTCQAQARDIRIRGAKGFGIKVRDCTLDAKNVSVQSVDAGLAVHEEGTARLTGAWFDAVTLEDLRNLRRMPGETTPENFRRSTGASNPGVTAFGDGQITLRQTTIHGFGVGATVGNKHPPDEPVPTRNVTPGSIRIESTRFTPRGPSVVVFGECPTCKVHNSSLLGDARAEVVNRGPSTLDARHNWWGSPDGPADGAVEGDVLVEPWKTQGPGAESDHGLPGASAAAAIVAVGVAAVAWAARRSGSSAR